MGVCAILGEYDAVGRQRRPAVAQVYLLRQEESRPYSLKFAVDTHYLDLRSAFSRGGSVRASFVHERTPQATSSSVQKVAFAR